MGVSTFVEQIDSTEMDQLCKQLANLAPTLEKPGAWPREQLQRCAEAGVFRWFANRGDGGFGWSERDQALGYLRLAEACLTTTFVLTQRVGAQRRIATSESPQVTQQWMKPLLSGEVFATVGISHLTTSRQHASKPVLMATQRDEGYELSGYSPWVTGGAHADAIVVGATMEDQREILACVSTHQPGVRAEPGVSLLALEASCTGKVEFDRVVVPDDMIIAGPAERVMSTGAGGNTGGIQTSILALGLSQAAVRYMTRESTARAHLQPIAQTLQAELDHLRNALLSATEDKEACDLGWLRGQANRMVLRATQAAMTAAKGAGFVQGHPVGRWCREALFFLVWSCPQPVSQSYLCELAGISE